ncbi:hypothetical protein TcBrA4_0033610 [Trypanosoma cruzi]|nr:hypothetical protein TcBrA4_0033610 [Trypanosoma cruzi]
MIACRSAFAAVQLVRELQQVFLQHDWGTSVIDDAYRMFEEDRAEEERSTCRRPRAWTLLCTGSTGTACACVSECTPGLCDIRRDEVTKGVRLLRRDVEHGPRATESVGNGGQVLLTRAGVLCAEHG